MKLYKTHHGPRGPILHVCMVAAMSELHFYSNFLANFVFCFFPPFQIPTFFFLILLVLVIHFFNTFTTFDLSMSISFFSIS